jgi:hypothetical protein
MRHQTVQDGVVRREWDTDTRTYTERDEAGEVVETRAFTPVESVWADAMLVEETAEQNGSTLRSRADQALAANQAFLASSRTNAQSLAQVTALTRQMNGVIRLLLGRLDGTD